MRVAPFELGAPSSTTRLAKANPSSFRGYDAQRRPLDGCSGSYQQPPTEQDPRTTIKDIAARVSVIATARRPRHSNHCDGCLHRSVLRIRVRAEARLRTGTAPPSLSEPPIGIRMQPLSQPQRLSFFDPSDQHHKHAVHRRGFDLRVTTLKPAARIPASSRTVDNAGYAP